MLALSARCSFVFSTAAAPAGRVDSTARRRRRLCCHARCAKFYVGAWCGAIELTSVIRMARRWAAAPASGQCANTQVSARAGRDMDCHTIARAMLLKHINWLRVFYSLPGYRPCLVQATRRWHHGVRPQRLLQTQARLHTRRCTNEGGGGVRVSKLSLFFFFFLRAELGSVSLLGIKRNLRGWKLRGGQPLKENKVLERKYRRRCCARKTLQALPSGLTCCISSARKQGLCAAKKGRRRRRKITRRGKGLRLMLGAGSGRKRGQAGGALMIIAKDSFQIRKGGAWE